MGERTETQKYSPRLIGWICATVALGLLLACGGCTRTVYLPTESHHSEREASAQWRSDTVTRSDTRLIFIKGDTVIDRRESIRERVREVHDTILYERTDTVTRVRTVERRLTKWQQTKMDFGGFAMGGVAAILLTIIMWIILKCRRR